MLVAERGGHVVAKIPAEVRREQPQETAKELFRTHI
jgi:hypothetical protein